jgi:hypothetical protein
MGRFWISFIYCSNSLLNLEKEVPGKGGAKGAVALQGPSFSPSFPSLGEFAYGLPGLLDGEGSGAGPLGL